MQSRCLIHTCLPLMSKKTTQIDSNEEQLHMKIDNK
ncbi:unnamed protein product, partial [Adineta steineri]